MFLVAEKDIYEGRTLGRSYTHSIGLFVKLSLKRKAGIICSELKESGKLDLVEAEDCAKRVVL